MEWYEKLYRNRYSHLCGFASPEETRKEVQFVTNVLQLKPGDHLLDLCCGFGRHTHEIAKLAGCRVTGFDLSAEYIQLAREKYSTANTHYQQGDMRHLPWKDYFQAVVNLFTSFGFFAEDVENEKVLREVNKVLKPGGLFLLDYENKYHFIQHDVRQRGRHWQRDEEGTLYLIRNSYDVFTEREQYWVDIYENDEFVDRVGYDIRLYSFPELEKMLVRNGFQIVQTWGDFDHSEFSLQSRRLITLAQKMDGSSERKSI